MLILPITHIYLFYKIKRIFKETYIFKSWYVKPGLQTQSFVWSSPEWFIFFTLLLELSYSLRMNRLWLPFFYNSYTSGVYLLVFIGFLGFNYLLVDSYFLHGFVHPVVTSFCRVFWMAVIWSYDYISLSSWKRSSLWLKQDLTSLYCSGNRLDALRICIGGERCKKLADLRLFMVS